MSKSQSVRSAATAEENNPSDLETRAALAAGIARSHAVAVDRDARFPAEAFAELRRQRLLGIMIPKALGGEGATLSEIADVCYTLGQACSSTGMIYAMHQVKLACVVRHTHGSKSLEAILSRAAREQLLFASSTTEGQGGGNIRASEAPMERDGDRISLVRAASCISYGNDADGIVTTARRHPDAAPSDQVLLVFLKSQYTLEHVQGWDTLGMRGTCSDGFTLRAQGDTGNLVPEPYETIHTRSMVPAAHLTWGAVWAGIAAAATARAQAFMRNAARQGGPLPPGAPHFTQAVASLRTLRGLLASSLRRYEAIKDDVEALGSQEFQSMITLTKVEVSELATATVMSAMRACGLSGYRNGEEYSIGRHLRDVLSSPIMINNDRILSNLVTQSVVAPLPARISG